MLLYSKPKFTEMNRIYLSSIILVLFSQAIFSQLPNMQTMINCGVPDISSMTAGDRDRDGDLDLFVSSLESDKIIMLENDSGQFVPQDYMSVSDPVTIGMEPINGSDNFYYATSGTDGITFLFGFNPYFPTGTMRQILPDSLGKVSGTAFGIVPNPITPHTLRTFVALSDRGNKVHFMEMLPVSFNDLAPRYIESQLSFQQPMQVASLAHDDTEELEFMVTDEQGSAVRFVRLAGSVFNIEIVKTDSLPINLPAPYGIAATKSPDLDNADIIFVTDKQESKLYKFTRDSSLYSVDIVDEDLSDPGLIYLYDIDGDTLQELFLIDSNLLWMYPGEITERSSQNGRELVTELSEEIQGVLIDDLTGDGEVDIVVFTENSGELLLISDDAVSATEEHKLLQGNAFPNPTTGLVFFESDHHPEKIKLIALNGKTVTIQSEQNSIDLSELSSGTYLLEYVIGEDLYRQKVILTNEK